MRAWWLVGMSLALLVQAACTVEPPKHKGSYYFDRSLQDATRFLDVQITSCWSKDWNLFQDGIVYSKRDTAGYTVFEVSRYGPDIGRQPAFLLITVSMADDGGSTVEVEEGNFDFITYMNLTPDIPRWFEGDVSC